MSRDDLHFRLRIPPDLKDRVQAAADANRRSMTAEIVAALVEKYPAPASGDADDLMRRIEALPDHERRNIFRMLDALDRNN